MKRILIFAGAGASYAVSRSKYPTTVGFLEKFPDALKKDKLIHQLSVHFESRFGDATPDVEKILWCLEELLSFCALTQDPKSPVNWLIPSNLLPSLVGSKENINQFAQVAQLAIQRVTSLRNQINAQLYEVYGDAPSDAEIGATWGPLLKHCVKGESWIDLVTTNYDVVLESAADLLGLDIGYGLSRGPIPRLDLGKWKDYLTAQESPYSSGLITKLHGSLNWQWDKSGVVFSGTGFRSDHKHHAAIYPGFKGVPANEPFSLFHDYFERTLEAADHVIFIGFAFRDDYINTLLRRSSHQKQFIVLDPSNLPSIPRELKERIHHIKSGFDAESTRKVIGMLN